MPPITPLDTIYTAEEAAERLRIKKRPLIKLARNLGACSVIGRNYLFSEKDILDIWQAVRAEPVRYKGRAVRLPGARITTERTGDLVADAAFDRLLRRASDDRKALEERRRKRKADAALGDGG